jgi:FHS family L-fucose permease-like MFS transporter
MAEKLDPEQSVDFEKLLIATIIETQALAELMFEKGIITQDEYVAKLKQVQAEELNAVMGPYVAVAGLLIVIWLLILFNKNMPKASDADTKLNLAPTFKRLISNSNYVWGVVAQFFYVGAQIGVWSFTIRYVMKELNLNEADAASYYLASLILFAVSRFICTGLMKFITPRKLLLILALAAILFTGLVIFSGGIIGVYALIAISFSMSLMFPTIFGLAIQGLGEDTKIGGSGLIMAILGGAVLTAVQGWISDSTGSINYAYLVPMVCFAIIAVYSIFAKHEPRTVAA